ncbi:MAG TPA: TIGR03067 domain-containing protein [Urbifossiella sp.]|nr:TIGR03067 domain-containing protein [Urbifossiella sp.]
MQAIAVLVLLAPNSPDATAQKDIARLDGAWVVTSAEVKGKKLDQPPLQRVVFAAGKAGEAAGKEKGAKALTYTLDPAKSPKVIEAVEDGGKGKRMVGSYEVGADTLRLCLSQKGVTPAEFRTGPDSDAILLELRREKR